LYDIFALKRLQSFAFLTTRLTADISLPRSFLDVGEVNTPPAQGPPRTETAKTGKSTANSSDCKDSLERGFIATTYSVP
jgi:hypothetical protein